ncbi:carboxylic acid reductase [Mycobacterium sp. AZCC_0083]|uniref:carboxylic acid reductase n=1 Tax=Mycobacterium sp. AZCC_0083 TaxID=2735882 RepID=UPI00161835ED|nr:carboxylic acid reductase [Mycobacterium sp. AZCC_0083]MBB5164118.1 fatty acid CoA ligase FadD9 [Mycobacterium sp. AZCC_0083]
MSTPANAREARLQYRFQQLTSGDAQLIAAQPDPTISATIRDQGLLLTDVIRTVMTGYADRPALGQRAVDYVTDATGRTFAKFAPRFDTLTYGETWARVKALADALANNPVHPGDRVATLGFTSADYAVVDMALALTGAVSVPLQTSAPVKTLHPILVETEPVAILSSVDHLTDAVELALTAHAPQRLVVFDYHPEIDDHREAFASAATRLAELHVTVETLDGVIRAGAQHSDGPELSRGRSDDLRLLIYTSGSTGTPKGAMYTDRLMAKTFGGWFGPDWDTEGKLPAITLSFMPVSHIMGRVILYSTLGAGGTAYFAAKADLSTLLDDLALVRPTKLDLVPRLWEMLFQEVQSEVDRRAGDGTDRDTVELQVMAEQRENLLGGRQFSALTGSAPISPELRAWTEDFIDIHLVNGYGSTEDGIILVDDQIRRPPVLDYKLVDVPDLGYFATDRPHPRGELWVKTPDVIPGYYKRPEVTAELFDADGWYHTGDVFAEHAPDHLTYVDRRNNVLKLSQGEFVTVSKLEAAYGGHPSVRQIFVYGNSARSYVLAVVVPTDDALASVGGDVDAVKPLLSDALQSIAREADLQSYEIPRDFIVETRPFTLENGLLTGIRKLARPQLKEYYGPELEQLYVDLTDGQADVLRTLRQDGANRPVLETVSRAAGALLGAASADAAPDAQFTDLGGDSLSALTFANLLHDIFGVDVPVGVIVSPASDLAAIAAYVEDQRSGGSKRPTFDAVHGRDATEVRASDLTLDKFLDEATLAAAPSLPGPSSEFRTVLLTGATGFLGRYLLLEWLERMDLVDGKVITLVRAKDSDAARERVDATFDSGDPKLLAHYRELAADHLEVLAGDKGEANLGLEHGIWQRLADTVDLIVDPAALVNHVLPYSQLFGPNVVGTAELIRIALTTKIKPFVYVSTIGVGDQIEPGMFVEVSDVRQMSATRSIDDGYANGYGNSKWGGEVLLREAHDLAGLPVSVFRCDMIMADTTYAGQLNVPDMFTRMMLSLVATGVAPNSFYELDAGGSRQRAHFDGLPVEFIADAISTLGANVIDGYETYHVMNPYDDGISMDTFADWLIEAGYPIIRVPGYAAWLERFETTLRALPEKQRNASLIPLLHNYQKPEHPINGSLAPADHFRAAVQEAKIGPDKDIPHISAPVIVKYATDLELLGLL